LREAEEIEPPTLSGRMSGSRFSYGVYDAHTWQPPSIKGIPAGVTSVAVMGCRTPSRAVMPMSDTDRHRPASFVPKISQAQNRRKVTMQRLLSLTIAVRINAISPEGVIGRSRRRTGRSPICPQISVVLYRHHRAFCQRLLPH